MTNPNYYLTTTIPYVNAKPHIGFALELVQADVIAHHKRLEGFEVRLQTGTDENSLKNVSAAEAAGQPVSDFVASNADAFRELQQSLGISASDFIRTAIDERHAPAVRKLWQACFDKGDIYRKSYSGLYCNGCEQFWKVEELEEGCCPEHGKPPHHVTEENWFFRLSRYRDAIRGEILSGKLKIVPAHRRNEVLALLEQAADDFSISRPAERARGWGISVPHDDSQTIYVWFDALGNYLSALGYGGSEELLHDYWTGNAIREHLVGKGVTKFHALYWPAILLSAGLPLPDRILVHGYVTVDGKKIGKSNGNAIDPVPLVEQYGRDVVRYFLLRHVRTTEDGDFTIDRLITANNGELVGQLGNLLNRVLTLVEKHCGGHVPAHPGGPTTFHEASLELSSYVRADISSFALSDGLARIQAHVAAANRYIVEKAPWTSAKLAEFGECLEAKADLDRTLNELCRAVAEIGHSLQPYLPDTAEAVLRRVGLQCVDLWAYSVNPEGNKIQAEGTLFCKLR